MVCTKTGLYHNEVTFSLTSTQRLGNEVNNCKWPISAVELRDKQNNRPGSSSFCSLKIMSIRTLFVLLSDFLFRDKVTTIVKS